MSFIRFHMLQQADTSDNATTAQSPTCSYQKKELGACNLQCRSENPSLVFPVNDAATYAPSGLAKPVALGDRWRERR
jgi:hypothetical protein